MGNKRLFVVGDIHGMFDKFISLMDKINTELTEDDTLIFLGDYIDRGPDSFKVVDYIIKLKNKICLMGNHEAMMTTTTYLSLDNDSYLWDMNGGRKTKKSYREEYPDLSFKEAVKAANHEWFYRKLDLYHETDKFFFVHAGINPFKGLTWSKQDLPTLIWIRYDFIDNIDKAKINKIIVHGHTIEKEGPIFSNGRIGIDTGSFTPDGKISCVILPECKILQSD